MKLADESESEEDLTNNRPESVLTEGQMMILKQARMRIRRTEIVL